VRMRSATRAGLLLCPKLIAQLRWFRERHHLDARGKRAGGVVEVPLVIAVVFSGEADG